MKEQENSARPSWGTRQASFDEYKSIHIQSDTLWMSEQQAYMVR